MTEQQIRRLKEEQVDRRMEEQTQRISAAAAMSSRQVLEQWLKEQSQKRGASQKLADLKQQQAEASAAAEIARREYEEDIQRGATLSPEEQVHRKRTAGEGLTAAELRLAGQFHEFRDLVKSESEQRAREFGISPLIERKE